jgi:Protein of unknown function (DUF1553)/Protein of unknown function (DUF1549)/Concanavalin A-like lectin/glucanases superfamily/Planctomycete cytochrome C
LSCRAGLAGVLGLFCLTLPVLAPAAPYDFTPQAVEFNRDIRPILSDKCYTCHGPDNSKRLSKLRFDTEAGAKQDLGGRFAIVPGDTAKSEIIRRITAANPAVRMPLGGAPLSETEIALIRAWIEQGAQWQKHWSLIPPKRPEFPQVSHKEWPKNGIDWFVLQRLEREGLNPSPEADRPTLIRRVTLDLTGLPPTLAEVEAFLADTSPNAYEKVVDRLLAAPSYGERMAAPWLAAARYADTNGYQTDGERYMWRWRDWVIDAFNRNMPFDRFTVEQIAGDMLPNATLNQKIATGFNRNHRGNGEGGIIPEEYAAEYVVDRVDTTASVWLGLTVGCARCHDHKYDPITQKEFYQLFAYFNNVPEKGLANKYGNSAPTIQAPTPEQQSKLKEMEEKLSAAEKRFADLQPELTGAQQVWEASLDKSTPLRWSVHHDLLASYALDGDVSVELAPQAATAGKSPTAKFQDGDAQFAPGQIGQAANFDGKRFINAGDVANFGMYDKFTLAAWINATELTGAIVTRATDVTEGGGYGLYLKDGKLQANLVARWLDDAIRVETEQPLDLNRWHHVMMTYDGRRTAEGVKIYLDGKEQKCKVLLDTQNNAFQQREPLRIGAGGGPENRFHGSIEDVRVYNAAVSAEDAAILADPKPVTEIVSLPVQQRSQAEADRARFYFLENEAPPQIKQAWRELVDLRAGVTRFKDSLPTVMVMEEMAKPRETHVLIRGAYDRPGERVQPGVPAVLPPLPTGAPNNRLGLAKWLVDPSNPLTARVTVNRFWQMYFGLGLVKTVDDFGSQGEWPSHPELLDWLATEFVRTGWDIKAMQKLIVTSATYRQSSQVTPELLQKDPENRLLARGPRVRLPAEAVRDEILAIAGLLVQKVGGPSVKPYQPAGLWKEIGGGEYQQDRGENLYRRSLYTFWKRTAPPPSMILFDAAGRETCTVFEARTNTPLQALDLMNDVAYLEAARVMAERMMTEGGGTPADRIDFAFRLATSRRPSPAESQILLQSFLYFRDKYQTDPESAVRLLREGDHPRNLKLEASELAAYTTVSSLILNLDEVLTKQ